MSLARFIALLPFSCVLCLPPLSHAQFAAVVHDPIATAQSVINTGRELLQQAQAYERQLEQLRAAWTQIQNQIKIIEAAYQNLKRMPDHLNFIDLVTLKGKELSKLLDATEGLSFMLDEATQQFTKTYAELSCASSDAQIKAAYAEMYKLQMGSTKSAVQLQSIKSNVMDAFERLCALLSGSVLAQGNLDMQQIQAQQAAQAAKQKAQADAARAAAERVQALRSAEKMVKEEMARCMTERFLRLGATPAYVADTRLGELHKFTW